MLLNWKTISEIYEGVISGSCSLEDADRWGCSVMNANDLGTLEFEPAKDKADLWEAAMFLFGIDLQYAPGEYLHSVEQVSQVYEQRWKSRSA